MSVVRETDGEYLAGVDLPAVDASLTIDDGVPATAGERRFEKAEQSEKVLRRESLRGVCAGGLSLQEHRMRGQTTGLRRISDRARKGATGSLDERETRQLESWEDEGGQMPEVSAPVPILIIDNDVNSASSLENPLHGMLDMGFIHAIRRVLAGFAARCGS